MIKLNNVWYMFVCLSVVPRYFVYSMRSNIVCIGEHFIVWIEQYESHHVCLKIYIQNLNLQLRRWFLSEIMSLHDESHHVFDFFPQILWYPEYMYTLISICKVYLVFCVTVSVLLCIFSMLSESHKFLISLVYIPVQKNIFKNRQPSPH